MPKWELKYCHHCHTKKDVLRCERNEKCAKGYCANCIEKYGTRIDVIVRSSEPWLCFGCRSECLCSQCRKRGRGLEISTLSKDDARCHSAAFAAATVAAASEHISLKDPLAALQSLKLMGPNYAAKPIVPSRVGSASSVFRGVSSQGARWRTRICIQKQEYTVGDFDTEENAALAYDQEAIRHNKLKNLNFLYKGINDNLLGVQQVAMQSRGLQIDARSAEVMAQALREHEDSSASSALGTAQPVSTGSEEYSGSSAFADYSYGSSTSESPYGGSSAATGSSQPHAFGGGKPASLSATGVIDYSSSCGSSLDHSNASGYPRGFVNANDVATAAAAALQASAAGAGTFLRSITHPSESARSGEAEFDVLTTARAEPSGAPVTASPTDDYCRLCHHGGELLCCDSCAYVYHLSCLGMSKPPDGNWNCFECTLKVTHRVALMLLPP